MLGTGHRTNTGLAFAHAKPGKEFAAARSSFRGTQMQVKVGRQRSGRQRLVTQNFKFMKNLGLKKPAFLPDFGLEKRKALLDKFFTSFDKSSLQPLLSDDAKISVAGNLKPLSKEDFITFLSEELKASFPDFNWSHSTNGEKNEEGNTTVQIQAVGTHTGKPFQVRSSNLPPVEPSQKRLSLTEQSLKVKVEAGLIQEIQLLSQGTDLLSDIYKSVGGKVPAGV